LRGVVNTKPGGHVVRARSSSTVFSKTPVSGAALTFMPVGKPARARRSSWMFAGTLRNSSSGFISYGSSDSRRAARASQYHHPADIGQSRNMRARNCGVASSLRIWPIAKKKRGSRERSSPPCQIRTLILPRCPEARGNIDLDLNTDSKVLRTSGPRGVRSLAPAHHQTVFEPPFMTSIGPTIGVHARQ
jgi:hypothetical protein